MRDTDKIVILRNALREICESAAVTSVADCQIIAEEALHAIAQTRKSGWMIISQKIGKVIANDKRRR